MKYFLLILLTGCTSSLVRLQEKHLACVDHFMSKGMDGETARKTCAEIYKDPRFPIN